MDRERLRAMATPSSMTAALEDQGGALATAGDEHVHGELSSVRTARYRGHDIEVRTTYEITVDGRRFSAAITVDNDGRVHYHGLPTRDFASVIALVEKAIDTFPDDFAADDQEHDHGDHHGDHHGHGHGHGHGG